MLRQADITHTVAKIISKKLCQEYLHVTWGVAGGCEGVCVCVNVSHGTFILKSLF